MTRARGPDSSGEVTRDGVRLHYEVHGSGERTALLLPTWSIVHSGHWKMQLAYLARHCRVVMFDGRGNGRSDRPGHGYSEHEFAADALAVLDATQTGRAALVALSRGAETALLLATEQPERVERIAFVCPAVPRVPGADAPSFDEPLDTDEGWAKHNRHYWLRDYPGYAQFFFSQMFHEPHSTKAIEDAVGWALETTPEVLISTILDSRLSNDDVVELAGRIRCPALVIQGADDAVTGGKRGELLAQAVGCELVLLDGSGHGPHLRDPVKVNELLREFFAPAPPPRRWARGAVRRKRALYVSSPIGLGHARRDIAIAGALRELRPELEIDWLAQHPVTALLDAHGERIHPASAQLASESAHITSEAAGHTLHAFQAIRRMDESLLANYMVFDDLAREQDYDLWIGDEAWELDHYLHENPERKRAAFAWLTDFVGWLPMPAGGEHEAFLTADYNAEMIEHVERYSRLRDRAIFVGEAGDIVPGTFGPGLPGIRDWTERHYDFCGYVGGLDGEAVDRAQLGYGDERVCLVSVGGSGVGEALLRRVIEAFPAARERVPDLRMVVVTGPRISLADVPAAAGLDVRAFVPDLHRHLAVCDVAIVQGGLTTCMELTASRRPFLYFPLRDHFEQQRHVPWRLDRYRAGRRMDFDATGPAEIAAAIADELGREIDYLPVATDGAQRAANLIAELL